MSLNVRGLRANRVRANEEALAQIETRLQRLQQDEATADALLAEAQRAAAELRRQRLVLQNMQRNMTAELEESRAELVQECVANLPNDILRCIFEEAVSDGAPLTPFAIAAVCTKWRRVALDFSAMWSTVHLVAGDFADAHRRLAADHKRVVTLLSRSRSAPLNVFISARLQDCDAQMLNLVRRLFDVVGAHVLRWRSAYLGLPRGAEASLLDFLKGPTPQLVKLEIKGYLDLFSPGPSQSGYLPFAPRLEALEIDHSGMACSTAHGFPALKKLTLYPCTSTEAQIFEFLRMSSRSVQQLLVFTVISTRPGATIHFPNLTHLCITEMCMPLISLPGTPAICTPALVSLELVTRQASDIDNALAPFLDAISGTLRKLILFLQPVTVHSLPVLARLRNLEELVFRRTPESNGVIRDDALELLSTSNPPIWPRLARIKRLVYNANGDNAWSTDKFLQFITSRNPPTPREYGPDEARPCMLREVVLENAPHWLVAEVQRLLAL